jgi:exosortase
MATDVQSPEIAYRPGAIASLRSGRLVAPVYVLALAPLPFIALQVQMLWRHPHYQFFPFVPLGAGILAWGKCRRLGTLRTGSRWQVAPLVIGSWLLLALASFLVSPWLGSMAALTMLAAAIAAIGGRTLLRCLLPAWAFLGLAVGLPFNFDQQLISRLQDMTSRIGSLALDALGVFHVMEGNVVRVSGRAFGVEQACSGIYSLFSVLFCTLFFVLWARRPPIRAVITIAAGACWVLGGNIVRVVTVVYLETHWGVDVSRGWRHDVLSLVVFSATLLLIASTDCLLDIRPPSFRFWPARGDDFWGETEQLDQGPPAELLGPSRDPRLALDFGAPTRLPGLRRTWLGSWIVAVSFAFLGLVQMAGLLVVLPWQKGGDGRFTNPWAGSMDVSSLRTLEADALPAVLDSFRRKDFTTETRGAGSSLGEMSRYWRYQFRDSSAIVSVDFPFQGWHDLPICYRGQGWAVVERERDLDSAATRGEGGQHAIEVAKLEKQPGRYGYLLFCLFDESGNPVEPFGNDLGSLFRQRLAFWQNLWEGNGMRGGACPGSVLLWTYQVQLFIESEYLLTAGEQGEARSFFRELLSAIRRQGPRAGGIGL